MFGRLSEMKGEKTFARVAGGVLHTPDGSYRLEFFAVVVASTRSGFYEYAFPDISSRRWHLDQIRAHAVRYREIGITEEDRLVALSTCSYEFQDARTIVIARLAGQPGSAFLRTY
jgi:sortase B